MTTNDPKDERRSSLPPEEEAQFDSLFDRLTDDSLRPSDPKTSASQLGATLTAAAAPVVIIGSEPPRPVTRTSRPPARTSQPPTRTSRPPQPQRTRSSVPAPQISLRPSIMVGAVTREGADGGAAAARRTVRKRAGRRGQLAFVGRGAEVLRARAELLAHLAQRSTGTHRARLWTATAELHAQLDEHDIARDLRGDACKPDAIDLVGLRAHRRDATIAEDWARVVELLKLEATLPLPPLERAHALTCAASIELFQRSDAERASELCKEALVIDAHAPSAALLWVTARRVLADRAGEGTALSKVAHSSKDVALRAAALTWAGHAFEAAGDPRSAFAQFSDAVSELPSHVDAAFGAMRSARAAQQPTAAATTASAVARTIHEPEARAAWLRAGARAAWAFGRDATLAQSLFGDHHGRLGLRLAARIACGGDDPTAYRIALERWAQAAGGSERAVALVELARLSIDAGNFDAAEQALVDAAVADGNLGTVRVVREMLVRKRGHASGPSEATSREDDEDVLTAAAKLANDPTQALHERDLLRRAARQGDDALTGEVIGLDAAALAGDREAVFQSVLRKAARARPEERVGPLLSLLDYLPADEWGSRRNDVDNELRLSAPHSALALRQRLRAVLAPADKAALWQAEADISETHHASFCATVAGDILGSSQVDPTAAYRDALQHTTMYEPAAWALERVARENMDMETLLDVQERLADHGRTASERAARLFRAGLLYTASAPSAAADRLRRALTEHPGDSIITELLIRLSATTPDATLADRLLASIDSAGPDAKHAGTMRAALLLEDASEWSAAAKLYRQLIESSATHDPFAQLALDRAELLAGEHARVAERRIDAVRKAEDAPSRMVAFAQLAEFERGRGDMQSAVLALHGLREVAPYNVHNMRALERYYLEQKRAEDLNDNVEAIADALADPADVAAYLRFRIALAQEEGASIDEKDRLLADRIPQTAGDAWCMRREAAAGRRARDTDRVWRAIGEQIPHVTDAMERASLCLRALDTSDPQAQSAMAALLTSAVSAAPEHPLASEELARLYETAGDMAAAAQTFEIAARASHTVERKVSLWYRAAVLWQDHVNDDERALTALREASSLQLLHRDVFSRLHLLLSTRGDQQALGALLEARIAAGGDASLVAGLHTELSTLRSELKDKQGAKAGLHAALQLDATNATSWRALAELQLGDQEWNEAADSLIQLARISKDQAELRWAFFTLGDLYEQKLPDLKRAEIAFSRVVKLAPEDDVAIERLANVFVAQKQLDMAERALRRLCDLRKHDHGAWVACRIRLARVIEDLGQPRRGEDILEETRRNHPLDVTVNSALADHHQRQQDDTARAMHVSRAVSDYRQAIATNIADSNAWLGLVDMLDRRGKRDAADLCAQVAYLLDVEAPLLRERRRPAAAGAAMLSPDIDDLIAPAGLTTSTRVVLKQLGPVLEKLLTVDTRGPGAERLKAPSESMQRMLQIASTWLGTGRVELYVNRTRSCHVSDSNPWTVAVGDSLLNDSSDAEKLFLFTRALKLATSDLVIAVRTEAQQFGAVVRGLIRHIDPTYEPAGVDVPVMDEWARRIGKVLSRRQREDVASHVLEMAGDSHADPARLGQVCDRFGARAALVATGDVRSAITALMREANLAVSPGDARAAQRDIARHPIAGDLLSFAISDACFTAREIALASAVITSPGTTRAGVGASS